MVWSGVWNATTFNKVKDGVVMPPPDFGTGPKIGGGSWQWGISTGCGNKSGALDYLKFSLQAKYMAQFATKLGLIPATDEAAAQSPGWGPNGPRRFYLEESKKFALIRPPTAAYPYITTTFAKAAQDIVAGGDPKKILDTAANNIDQNLKSNNYYGF
jgi:multiple sugar transport system substrate-binding protein